MTKKKQSSKTTTLPKTLWGFYFKHAIRGNGWMILAGAILSFIVAFDRVLQPLIQSWTVAIFETPVPAGMTLMEHALPTVLMIIGLNLTVTTLAQIRGWLGTHWAPRAYRQISEVLTAYVHRQSMAFWTGRMAVVIAHRLSTLRNMDRIIVIKDCHVIEQGSHQSLLRKRGEYARLWKMQSGGFLQE